LILFTSFLWDLHKRLWHLFVIISLERDYPQKSKIFYGDPREGELVSFSMHALHAAFFMPLLLFQNGVLGRKDYLR
jgi:hypothetical protein